MSPDEATPANVSPELSDIARVVGLPSMDGATLGRFDLGQIDEVAEHKCYKEIQTNVVVLCILKSESMVRSLEYNMLLSAY